jgi:hypothetical protein
MPRGDYDSKREFTKYYIMCAIRDNGRRSKDLNDIDDDLFDTLADEADEFWNENGWLRRRGVDLRRAARHFFEDRNDEEDGEPNRGRQAKGFWENPDLYGNYESAKLTERARRKGPHRLEMRNGRLRTIRQRRR